MTVHTFPGQIAARNALTDPKTSDWVRAAAADMTGDVAPVDLTMLARGSHWDEPPPRRDYRCEPDDNRGSAMLGHVGSAAVIFMTGWVAGLLTVLFTIS